MGMNCTRCHQQIVKGQRYHRTKNGPHHAECVPVSVPMNETNLQIWNNYCQCITSMAVDSLCGRGPTYRAFVNNLRLIAENMEKLLLAELEKKP